jgi:hypothetical protein
MGILMGIVWMNHQQGEIHQFTPFFFVCPRIGHLTPNLWLFKNHAVNGDHVFLFPVGVFHGLDQQKLVI